MPTLARPVVHGSNALAFPMDATLGVPGRPQSGTGQFTLLTGLNGPRMLERHFGPWTPTALRPALEESSVLRTLLDQGVSVAFANAYPGGFEKSRWFKRPAPVPLAAYTAGLITRTWEDLAQGRAVASSITHERVRTALGKPFPQVSPRAAGRNLARIAGEHAFTLFGHYGTDAAGHEGDLPKSRAALELVDAFLSGVLDGRGPDTGVFVASDHGNIELLEAGHTTNPALGLWFPPPPEEPVSTADLRSMPTSLVDVAPWLLGWLGG